MSKTITVYCASSRKVAPKYFKATEQLADELLAKKAKVKYGGGSVGLMGAIADRYLQKGGHIQGVIPEFMVKVEWAHPGVKDMLVVHDMHERKKKLVENSDGVIALPGGIGTLEELSEIMTLKRLGKFNKPILLLNTDGFYNPLNEFLGKMIEGKFLPEDSVGMWKLIDCPTQFWKVFSSFSTDVIDLKAAQL